MYADFLSSLFLTSINYEYCFDLQKTKSKASSILVLELIFLGAKHLQMTRGNPYSFFRRVYDVRTEIYDPAFAHVEHHVLRTP